MSNFALVMHGGGMRGAYGAGVIETLRRMCGPAGFALVLGTSAGAANAAGMAADMGDGLKEIWTTLLDVRRFIRPFRPRWITNTDYLIQVCHAQGLTNERIRDSSLRLVIAATHYLTGETHFFSNHDDILSVVHASISMPVLCRTPVSIGGEPYLDGGITASTSVLIDRALAEGAERIVALDLSSPLSWVSKLGLKLYARRKTAGLRAAIQRMTGAPHPEPIGAYDGAVYLIRPLHMMVSRLTRIPLDLERAYEMGRRETLEDGKLREFLGVM